MIGQVGQVGADAYNARRCAIAAGIPTGSTAMNVNRLCGSGLQAIVTAANQLVVGDASVVVAGGCENMSASRSTTADEAAAGASGRASSSTDAVPGDQPVGDYAMGETAERVADRYDVSREAETSRTAQPGTRIGGDRCRIRRERDRGRRSPTPTPADRPR